MVWMTKKRASGLISVTLACMLGGCTFTNLPGKAANPTPQATSPQAIYQKITAEQAKAMMEEGEPYVLLDVRTDEEFSDARIAGAILIPDYEIGNRAEAELPDKHALRLIYCRSGRRSANVAHEMVEMGYTNVYDFGGILDWPFGTVSD